MRVDGAQVDEGTPCGLLQRCGRLQCATTPPLAITSVSKLGITVRKSNNERKSGQNGQVARVEVLGLY